jgi:hypothetical protein
MNQPVARFVMIAVIMAFGITKVSCQFIKIDSLNKGTIAEQMKYVEDKTLIYENYRAIREDMFQKIKNNSIDSLTKARGEISGFVVLTGNLNNRIDSLNNSLKATKEELKVMTRTKNSIKIIGIEVDKNAYNSLMWLIIVGLAILLVIGFLTFKRNRVITINTKKELKDLTEEFEAYRKKTRLEREKMSMDHFNEVRKLKGG